MSFLIRRAADQIKKDGYIHTATLALLTVDMAVAANRLACGEDA